MRDETEQSDDAVVLTDDLGELMVGDLVLCRRVVVLHELVETSVADSIALD